MSMVEMKFCKLKAKMKDLKKIEYLNQMPKNSTSPLRNNFPAR